MVEALKKMKPVIGIRAYLTDCKKAQLEMQIRDAQKHFPEFEIVVALCGEEPGQFIEQNVTKLIYYSKKPLGLTPPWEILTDYAKAQGSELLIVVDGDDQHIFSEVKQLYDQCRHDLSSNKVVIPTREKRVVFVSDISMHGATLEDLENAFIRHKTNCRLIDLQPGLFMLSKGVISQLNFKNVCPWVGDIAFLDQLLSKGIELVSPVIKVRSQDSTISSRSLVFRSIEEYEKYFGISFYDIVKEVKSNPTKFLYGGRLNEINNIEKSFTSFKNSSKIKNMKGLILSGGTGTRLRPITHTTQKQLIPVANKPIIFYVIEDLVNAGIRDIGIIFGPNKEQMMSTIGDGSRWDAKITYIEQDAPRGLAHAVLIAEDFIGGSDFIMYLGDNLLKGGIYEFVERFNNSDCEASIMLTPVNDPKRFGIARLDPATGQIAELLEKPENPPSNLAIVGVYAFKKSIFTAAKSIKPSARGELEITDAMQWLINKGCKIESDKVKDWWKDTGKPEALFIANHLILDNIDAYNNAKTEDGAVIRGKVHAERGTVIKSSAVIRGPVTIGKNCVIGANVYIGPYTSIGDNVIIEDTEVEHSIILSNCEIKCHKYIADSLIGLNCKVFSSERSLPKGNKLIIGDNSEVDL